MIMPWLAAVMAGAFAAAEIPPSSPIASFDWTYPGQPEPGNRHWSSADGSSWTETYPSGKQEVQKLVGSATVGGCDGVVTTKPAGVPQTFIPNPGCPEMVLKIRVGPGSPWGILGRMRSIQLKEPSRHLTPM